MILTLAVSLTLLCSQVASDAVSLEDLTRFPCSQVVALQRSQNAHARAVCTFQLAYRIYHAESWWEIHVELRHRDYAWELLEDARTQAGVYTSGSLELLGKLQKEIGVVRYRDGVVPPAVPPQWVALFR